MTFRVELSRRAEADIKSAYAYIRKHGPADPKDWKAGLEQKLAGLETFPEACGLAPENEFVKAEIRQGLYGPFRIVFTIREQIVFVLTVRHAARLALRRDEMDKIQ